MSEAEMDAAASAASRGKLRSVSVGRGFTMRQALTLTVYKIYSRPLVAVVFTLTLALLAGCIFVLITGEFAPRLLAIVLAVGAIWSMWAPVTATISNAKVLSEMWRVGEVAKSRPTEDELWVRTHAGTWRFPWATIRPLKRLFGFIILEMDNDPNNQVALPIALWSGAPTRVPEPDDGRSDS